MDEYADFTSRRHQTVWHSLSHLVRAMIYFTVVIVIGCLFVPLLKNVQGLSGYEDDLRSRVSKERALLAQHTREVDLLKNDPTYIETIARDRLDMMKDGETIYRIDPAPTPRRLTQ